MRINKDWIIELVFYNIVCIVLLPIIFILVPETIGKFCSNATTIVVQIAISSLLLIFLMVMILELVTGNRYIQILQVPIEKFQIIKSDNLYIVSYNNKSYAIRDCYEEWLKQKTIKVTQYYNRKREETKCVIHLPYMRGS